MEPAKAGELRQRTGSLRTRLLFVLAAALTPILILSAVRAYFDARSSMEQRRNELTLIADRAIDRVEQYMSTSETMLEVFREEIAAGRCQRVYMILQDHLPALTNVALVGTDGLTSCSAVGGPGVALPDEDWMKMLADGRESVRTDAFYGESSKQWLFAILKRIDGPDGKFAGAAVLGLSIASLVDLFNDDPNLPEGIQLALTDLDGQVFGQVKMPTFDRRWIERAQDDPDGALVVVRTDDGGSLDLVIQRVGSEGVFALITRPSPGLFDELTLNPVGMFGLPFLTFFGALIAVWLAVDGLVLRWLARLRQVAIHFASGQYDYQPRKPFDRAPAEINRFASTMSQMATRIAERDRSLREALRTRDAAVREIHHRVKNNLQIVTSFLNLQSRQVKEPTALDVLAAARHRIDALSIVHQTLYQHERLDTVHLKPFLEGLLRHLSEALGMPESNIKFDWDIEDVERGSDDAIPIALFVLEAVTNAVKYAFENKGGRIFVSLQSNEDDIELIVRDDGVGLSQEQASASQSGLGSRLMTAFAKQLRGELSTESETGSGVTVKLKIPRTGK